MESREHSTAAFLFLGITYYIRIIGNISLQNMCTNL